MSINKTILQKMAKQYAPQEKIIEVQVGDKNVAIKVKPVLSLAEFALAAQEICDMQFATDANGNEFYVPYLREFAERYVVVSRFTDLDLSMLRKGDDVTYGAVEPIWQFLMSSIYEKILCAISYDDVSYSNNYYDLINTAGILVDMHKKQLEPSPTKLWAALDEVVDQMKQSFGEMTPEDMEETREAIKKLTHIDEGKIVELMR